MNHWYMIITWKLKPNGQKSEDRKKDNEDHNDVVGFVAKQFMTFVLR